MSDPLTVGTTDTEGFAVLPVPLLTGPNSNASVVLVYDETWMATAAVTLATTQLGALSPLMENGGRGEHRPWKIDEDIVPVYRYYALLRR